MKRLLCFLAIAFAAAQASAQFTPTIHGSPQNFPETASPATLKWQIATAADQRIGFTIDNVVNTLRHQYGIRQADAILYGVDWPAFQAAANDPAYTRSIISFGGVERESELVRNFTPGSFRLDTMTAIVEGFVHPIDLYGFPLLPFIAAGAAQRPDVPEPATWVLLCVVVVTGLLLRKRGRNESHAST